jgi:hypothetical protein
VIALALVWPVHADQSRDRLALAVSRTESVPADAPEANTAP